MKMSGARLVAKIVRPTPCIVQRAATPTFGVVGIDGPKPTLLAEAFSALQLLESEQRACGGGYDAPRRTAAKRMPVP